MMLSSNKKHNLLWSSLFLLISFLSIYIFLKSPFFEVQHIHVVVDENLLSLLDADYLKYVELSGLKTKENIFKLNLSKGKENISLLPEVKEVEISRKFPSTIIINVHKRQPVAMLSCGDVFIVLDAEGVCVQKSRLSKEMFPVITWENYISEVKEIFISVQPGDVVNHASVKAGLEVIDELPCELVEMLSEVRISENKVIIYTANGIQGRFGMPCEIYQKGTVFLQILKHLNENEIIEYIDVSSLKSPVIK
ncbi:FtsQ-type POTRA domain-containing protein [Peptococcaceae bacterium]|nr:FtsQ-type POTRA domain-containing protein [Peptococcaceae bacterium]